MDYNFPIATSTFNMAFGIGEGRVVPPRIGTFTATYRKEGSDEERR